GPRWSDSRRRPALAVDPEEADVARARDVRAPAELGREVAHAHHGDPVAVLVAEEGERAGADGVVVAHLLAGHRGVGAHEGVDLVLDAGELVLAHRPVMAEVEAEVLGIDQRAGLLDVWSEAGAG